MKKLLAFITALLVLGTVVFAEVSVKDLGDGNVEVTIFYGNPRATEVWVAGTWTDWAGGAQPMTKVEAGWEYKIVWPMDAEHKYKFLVNDLNGWTRDFKAPAEVDDGFGGFNGLIEVSKLVAIEAAKSSGDSSALEALLASSSGLRFGMYTQINLNTTFLTRGVVDPAKKGFDTSSVAFRAKSYWKISGNMLPNMPIFAEIKAFDGSKNLYNVTNDGEEDPAFADGFESFFTGMLFRPFNYMNGGNPILGTLKAGYNTPYVNLETAYGWAKPTQRETIIWKTITDRDANNGYLQFTNGAAISDFGVATLDVGIVPNVTDGPMAIRSWVASTILEDYTVEVQWDVKSKAADQTIISEFFEDYEGNLIIGAKANVLDMVNVAAQITMATDKETRDDAMAYQVNVDYNSNPMFGAMVKFGVFQPNAWMMFGDNGGVGDNAGHAIIELNPWVKVMDAIRIGVENKLDTDWEFEMDTMWYDLKPTLNVDLNALVGFNMNIDMYAKMAIDLSKYDSGAEPDDTFFFNEFGMKLVMNDLAEVVPTVTVQYGLQNVYKSQMYHTVIATAATKPGINVDAGLGLRFLDADASDAAKDANDMVGFILGANKTIESLKNVVVSGAFVYNMDPYEDDKADLKMDGYRPDHQDNGIERFTGKAKFRLGLKWDF